MTIDLLPTIARLIGAELPEHKIDGLDIWPLFAGEPGAKNPHDAYFFYYDANELQAVRSGDWKLFFPHSSRTMDGQEPGKDGMPGKYEPQSIGRELYNLRERHRRNEGRRRRESGNRQAPRSARRTSARGPRRRTHEASGQRRAGAGAGDGLIARFSHASSGV